VRLRHSGVRVHPEVVAVHDRGHVMALSLQDVGPQLVVVFCSCCERSYIGTDASVEGELRARDRESCHHMWTWPLVQEDIAEARDELGCVATSTAGSHATGEKGPK
jgi:hypothetical protein